MLTAATPASNGYFSINGVAGQAVTVRITKLDGNVITKSVTFPAAGAQPVDLGNVDVCVSTQPGGRLEMGFNLTGDGMTNKRYDLYYDALYSAVPEAYKDTNSNSIRILLVRPITTGLAVSATFEIPGTRPGTYVLNDNSAAVISLSNTGVSTSYVVTDSASLTVTISQYDSVGGRIKGTFSGNMGKYIPPTTLISRPVLAVTNGTFDVTRSIDQ
jgi:hypothetical protein